MRLIKLVFFVLTLCFNLTSCKHSSSKVGLIKCEQIIIDPQEAKVGLLSNVVENIQYIKLETSKDNLIGKIDKVIISNNYIFILDKSISRSIFKFDVSGNYLGKINKIGKGPGEYSQIRDFIVDSISKTIEIYEPQQRRIIIYDFNGNFKSDIQIGYLFSSFEKISGNYILHTNKMINYYNNISLDYSLLIVNSKGVLSNNFFEFNPKLKINNISYDLPKVLTKADNNVFVTKLLNDTVYYIANNQLIPKYVFNYGKYQMPNDYNFLPSDKLFKTLSSPSNFAFGHMLCAITSEYMYFTFGFKEILKNQYIAIYNIKNHNTYLYQKIENDIDGGIFNNPVTCYNNKLVSVISSEELVEYINNKSLNQGKATEQLKNFVKDISNVDNPILMLSVLKQNINK